MSFPMRPATKLSPSYTNVGNKALLLDQIFLEQCVWAHPQLRNIRAININQLPLPANVVAASKIPSSASGKLFSLICCIRLREGDAAGRLVFVSPHVPLSCNPEWTDIDLSVSIACNSSFTACSCDFSATCPSFMVDVVLCCSTPASAKTADNYSSAAEFTRLVSYAVSLYSADSVSNDARLTRLGRRYDDLTVYSPVLTDLLPPCTLFIQFEQGFYACLDRTALLQQHIQERATFLSEKHALQIAADRREQQNLHKSSNKITFSTFGLENASPCAEECVSSINSDIFAEYRREMIESVVSSNEKTNYFDAVSQFSSAYRMRSGYSSTAARRLYKIIKTQLCLEHSINQLHARLDATAQLGVHRRHLQDEIAKSLCTCSTLTRNVDFLAVRFNALQTRTNSLREANKTALQDLQKNHRIVQHNRRQLDGQLNTMHRSLTCDFKAVCRRLIRRQQSMVHDLMQLFGIERQAAAEPTKFASSALSSRSTLWSVAGLVLPDVRTWAASIASGNGDVDEEKSRVVALGYTLHVLSVLCAKILVRPLSFPVRFGSTTSSFIYDFVTPLATLKAHHPSFGGNVNEFSLSYFYRTSPTKDRQRFFYAILLLNLNIIQLRYEFGLQSTTCTDALENLCSFMLLRFDVPYRTDAAVASDGHSNNWEALKNATSLLVKKTQSPQAVYSSDVSSGVSLTEEDSDEICSDSTVILTNGANSVITNGNSPAVDQTS